MFHTGAVSIGTYLESAEGGSEREEEIINPTSDSRAERNALERDRLFAQPR